MAVIEEKINDNLVRHFSDNGKMILQVETGVEYKEAVDVVPCEYSYEETDKDIKVYPTPSETQDIGSDNDHEEE